MLEDLVKLMVEQWYLPETQVRKFISDNFGESGSSLGLEQIREIAGTLLQDIVLENSEGDHSPTP